MYVRIIRITESIRNSTALHERRICVSTYAREATLIHDIALAATLITAIRARYGHTLLLQANATYLDTESSLVDTERSLVDTECRLL